MIVKKELKKYIGAVNTEEKAARFYDKYALIIQGFDVSNYEPHGTWYLVASAWNKMGCHTYRRRRTFHIQKGRWRNLFSRTMKSKSKQKTKAFQWSQGMVATIKCSKASTNSKWWLNTSLATRMQPWFSSSSTKWTCLNLWLCNLRWHRKSSNNSSKRTIPLIRNNLLVQLLCKRCLRTKLVSYTNLRAISLLHR